MLPGLTMQGIDPSNGRKLRRLKIAEAICWGFACFGVITIPLVIAAAPFVAVIEYDEQNEATPKVTPKGISKFAVYYGCGLVGCAALGIMAPRLRRRHTELLLESQKVGDWDAYNPDERTRKWLRRVEKERQQRQALLENAPKTKSRRRHSKKQKRVHLPPESRKESWYRAWFRSWHG